MDTNIVIFTFIVIVLGVNGALHFKHNIGSFFLLSKAGAQHLCVSDQHTAVFLNKFLNRSLVNSL